MDVCIFIDYDNLLNTHKEQSLIDLARRLLTGLEFQSPKASVDCTIRFYGGWYEGDALTRMAQDVSVRVSDEFPAIINALDSKRNSVKFRTTAEMAYSLLGDPATHLLNTFRRKGAPTNLRISRPDDYDCSNHDCFGQKLRRLFKKRRCPETNCSKNINSMIERREQKIVDTLLTCDILHASANNLPRIILVSSDDDFLPAIRVACLNGIDMTRYHSKPFAQRELQTTHWNNITEKEL
jgi:hypothetical protein